MTLLIGVVLIVLSMQVAGATYCPECQVHYGSDVMSVNAPASAPQDAPGHIGPLSVLDSFNGIHEPESVNLQISCFNFCRQPGRIHPPAFFIFVIDR